MKKGFLPVVAVCLLLGVAGSAESATDPGPSLSRLANSATVVQTAKVTASDGAAGDNFGDAVAISGDTMVVGAPLSNSQQGAAYVFVKPATGNWADATEAAKLTASDGAAGDAFGWSVAIDGDTIVVGADKANTPPAQGAVYVFTEPAGGWVSGHETAKLTASQGNGIDSVGFSVAISGDTIVAGAPAAGTSDQGAAYAFVEPAGGWVDAHESATLSPGDPGDSDELGRSIAISGDTVVVGAPTKTESSQTFAGAVYVFTKPDGGWTGTPAQKAELTSSSPQFAEHVGWSVGISGDTIVAGAPWPLGGLDVSPGTAYVFVAPGGVWADGHETAKLTASDAVDNDNLGASVAIDGDTIVAGAPHAPSGGSTDHGAAYTFTKPAGGWADGSEAAKLTASDGAANDELGAAVSTSAGTVAAGAPDASVSGHTQQGAGYVFAGGGGGGGGTFTLTVTTGGAGSGTVTSSPAGISCGSACSHSFASGATVQVTATASADSSFAGFSGDCSGTGTCTVQMTQARSVTATFTPGRPTAAFTMPNRIRPGAVTTLNAGSSLNAAEYLWDLNGDGHDDVSCSTSQLETQFLPPPGRTPSAASSLAQVRLTVVGETGQTSTITDTSPFIGGVPISRGTSNFFNQSLSAYCVDFRKAGVCVTPATMTFSVIEATGCDLHQVTGTGDVPDENALVQSAIDQYQNDPEYVTYVKSLCSYAKLVGDPANCALVSQIDRRSITTLLNTNSILLWESHAPVKIDGLDFVPAPGHAIVISPLLQKIFWSDAEVELNGVALPLPRSLSLSFQDANAPLTLNASDDHVAHIGSFPAPSAMLPGLLGLLPENVDLSFVRSVSDARYTQIKATLALPLKAPWKFALPNGLPASLSATFRQSNANGLQLSDVHGTIDKVGFGDSLPVEIDGVNVGYQALAAHTPLSITGTIKLGDADVSLAPQQYYPDNGIVFWDGGLHSAGATLDIPCPELCLHLFPGVDLDQLHFGFGSDPTVIEGGGELKVVDVVHVHGGLAFAFPSASVPWTLSNKTIPELPGDWTPRTFTTTTIALAGSAGMDVPILSDLGDLANAYFVYSFPGYIAFGGGVNWNLFDIVTFDGGLSGELNATTKRFNFEGHLQTCVVDVLCGGAFGVVSSAGAGACFVVGPVSVGGGVQYARITEPFIWPVDGCKWSRFTEDNIFDSPVSRALSVLQAERPYVVTIKQGDPSRVVRLDGLFAAPAVEVTGPGGIDVISSQGDCTPATPTVYNGSTCLTVNGNVRIMRSPQAKQAVVGLENPAPGTYTITPLPGSPEFSHVYNASDVANLAISGQVAASGVTRTLRYNVPRAPGEQVTFLDVAPNGAARTIGTVVGGGTGSLHFTPAEGTAAHTVTAEVESAGIPVPMLGGGSASSQALEASATHTLLATRKAAAPSARLRIATFMPPKPVRPGAPQHVRATHKGSAVTVRWGKAAHASSYEVVAVLADKTSRTVAARRTSVELASIPKTQAGSISVAAVGRDGRLGPWRKVSFRATAKAPTLIAPFPAQRCVVPELAGKTERQADKALLLAGCAEGKLSTHLSRNVPRGRVLAQGSAPGAKRPLGTKVSLVLSKGHKR